MLSVTVSVSLTAESVMAAPVAPQQAAATYVVKDGDFLIGIAATLKVRLSDLLKANQLTPTSLIYPGMKLTVPAGGVVPAAAAPATPAKYTVKSGDYLGGIATRMGVKLKDLLAANNLQSSSMIHPGDQLVVPAGGTLPASAPSGGAPATPTQQQYVVRSGDSLSGIAQQMKVKLKDLLSTNKLVVTSTIVPGQKLKVPAGGTLPASSGGAVNSGNSRVDAVLKFAMAQLGEPYQFAAAGPDRWDCSGLTKAAYAEIGISLPHYSGAQVYYGSAVDWSKQAIKAGDLVFLESSVGSGIINHVGIAINATQWIQAPRTGEPVRVGAIPSVRVVAVRRLVGG
jgi:LysM repeat protein